MDRLRSMVIRAASVSEMSCGKTNKTHGCMNAADRATHATIVDIGNWSINNITCQRLRQTQAVIAL